MHPIFITVCAAIMKRFELYELYKYFAPVVVYIISSIFVCVCYELYLKIKRVKSYKVNNK